MYRPTVTITKHCYSDTEAWYNERETRINLPLCKKYAKQNKIEFTDFVARCLNHEFLHHLLNEEQDRDTSGALDNIAKRLKDFWLW